MRVKMDYRHTVKVHEVRLPAQPSSGHAVQFYEDDRALAGMLGQHIGAALEAGDTAIVVATEAHRSGLRQELASRKMNVAAVVEAGRFIELDAAETLARIMGNGTADKQNFEDTIGTLVRLAEAGLNPGQRLLVFGEMVALLWADGKADATLRLEELWNGLVERHHFHLLCAYPVRAFDRPEHRYPFFCICGEHTHINPSDSDLARGKELQSAAQREADLTAEIRVCQERIRQLQKTAKAGTWELDIVNDTFSFSSAAARMLGFELSRHVRLGQLMDLMYYSGDRDAVVAQLQAAQRHRKDLAATFRVRNGEETRIISIQGKTFYNSGAPIMLGVLSDVTPAGHAIVLGASSV